jgi:hypothetical protein
VHGNQEAVFSDIQTYCVAIHRSSPNAELYAVEFGRSEGATLANALNARHDALLKPECEVFPLGGLINLYKLDYSIFSKAEAPEAGDTPP